MSRLRVNYTHPKWTGLTLDKTLFGLGEPYQLSDIESHILISRDSLLIKRANLINERAQWAQFPAPSNFDVPASNPSAMLRLEYSAVSGSSPRAKFRRLFGRRLYKILFPTIQKSDTDIANYWGGDDALGPLSLYEKNTKVLASLDNYIRLIDAILATEINLSSEETVGAGALEDAQTETPTAPSLVETTTTTVQILLDFVKIELEEIPLLEAILSNIESLIDKKTTEFFDPTRELKTVANFGQHRQYLIESWRPRGTSAVQLKLTSPLSPEILKYDIGYIVRDVANSIIDSIQIEQEPLVDSTPYLRPADMQARANNQSNQSITEATLISLGLGSGSVGVISGSSISYEDRAFNRWYTADFNSSELNIDYTDYNNFVYYGSAESRLSAFRNKLTKIEQLGISASISSSNSGERLRAQEIEYIKRNFDGYEQFLYYSTATVPYTASAYYTESGTEYNTLATWPKQDSGLPYTTTSTSASSWFITQSAIAQRFDEYNVNYLTKHLPGHLQEDGGSVEFFALIAMFGHVMDNIKVYVDQFPNIYSSNPNPLEELSMDQVYEVATSFGLQLPNAYAVEELQSFIASTELTGGRISVAETWKRMLHSAIYITKAKGTRESIDAVMNVYGINSPLVQLKETSYPSSENFVQSDELAYGVTFTGSVASRIFVPFVSSSFSASSAQIRFVPNARISSSLLTGDTRWGIDLVPHPSASKTDYGRLRVVSGSSRVTIATSSYFPLFSDDYTSIMFSSQSNDLNIIQTDGDQILFAETITSNLSPVLWNATLRLVLGGSGSVSLGNFDGVVDEVYIWGEQIPYPLFEKQAYDPGSYYGNYYTSSYASLYTHIGFSQPLADITSSATNESPYVSASRLMLPTEGFTTASYTKHTRSIKQYTPIVGATAFSTNKVVVAPAPTFGESVVDENGSFVLSRTNSIKPLNEKRYTGGQDTIQFAVSPIDFVNQTIMRTMGVVDINYLIGSPRKIQNGKYTEANTLYDFYLAHYNQSVNPNQYIRFYKNAIKGPSEQVRGMIPARASLIEGVVIESPILHRTKLDITKKFRVDGTNTRTFAQFTDSASTAETSALAGTYTFDMDFELYPTAPMEELSVAESVLQYINPHTILTSSVISDNSGIAFLESTVETTINDVTGDYLLHEAIIRQPSQSMLTQSGYPRAPYPGIPGTTDSEVNTLTPFYDIRPAADFSDVGAISYFHIASGIYKFLSVTSKYAYQTYRAQFSINLASPVAQLYAPITLMSPDTTTLPGRAAATLGNVVIGSGESINGTIKLANLLSLLAIEGDAGLLVTLRQQSGELVFSGTLDGTADINPYLLMQSPLGIFEYTIQNTTGSEINSAVVFHFYAYEPLSLTPTGYLPRHYKFYKNTGVAQNRRNIIGCRIVFCPEGCPDGTTQTDNTSPVQITVSTRSGIVVNNPISQNPLLPNEIDGIITFGGNGPLADS